MAEFAYSNGFRRLSKPTHRIGSAKSETTFSSVLRCDMEKHSSTQHIPHSAANLAMKSFNERIYDCENIQNAWEGKSEAKCFFFLVLNAHLSEESFFTDRQRGAKTWHPEIDAQNRSDWKQISCNSEIPQRWRRSPVQRTLSAVFSLSSAFSCARPVMTHFIKPLSSFITFLYCH